MDDTDFDLHSPSDTSFPRTTPRDRGLGRVLVVLAVAVALGGGAYWVLSRRGAPTGGSSTAAVPAAPPPAAALGAEAGPVNVPALDASDAFVRELLSTLSSDPRFLAWLATDRLIRTFVVVVDNIAAGQTPSRHVRMMRPLSPFRVSGDDAAAPTVDPRSYDRYTALADAAASIDAAGTAKAYTILKPRIEEAYRDLGYPDTPFDRTLERAIVVLLETPVSDAAPRLRPAGASGYAYADARLEGLSHAQKQLLRFGPRNARVIQNTLRNMALALGIPADRLPVVRS